MDEIDFRSRFNSSIQVDEIDKNSNNLAENSDLFGDKTPLNKAHLHETAMGGTIAAVGPLYGPTDDVMALFENPDQEIPMGGTLTAVRPMDKTTYYETPFFEMITAENPPIFIANIGSLTALFDQGQSADFRSRWKKIQGNFIYESCSSVQQADELAFEVIEQITQMFSSIHGTLESRLNQGNDISTEELHKVLQHYRSFFNRLLV